MKVKKRTSKNNSTDIALMVESTTQEEFFEFDENKTLHFFNKSNAAANCYLHNSF